MKAEDRSDSLHAAADGEGGGISARETAADIVTLRRWIEECSSSGMVFFGGAGVSTESGIPDFRSEDGLYSKKFDYPAEVMLSRSFFDARPQTFFDFYCRYMIALEAKPNRAHLKLAELEQEGILSAVITQNIDGLHQAAGSTRVLELHGSVHRNHCMDCRRFYDVYGMLDARSQSKDGIPRCECGGIIKPDVVLYEEALPCAVMDEACDAIAASELFLVAGTSLTVNPAAGLVRLYRGRRLCIVNRSSTYADRQAQLVIPQSIACVLDF